jgi:hypothetical protein
MTVEQRALSNSYATWLLVAVSTLAAVYRWLNIGSRPRRAAPQAQHHVAPAGAAPEGVITDVGVLTAVSNAMGCSLLGLQAQVGRTSTQGHTMAPSSHAQLF